MRIVIDAMGTDERPGPDVEGAVLAAKEFGDEIILVGDEARVKLELDKHETAGLKIELVHAADEIEMDEKPQLAIRKKKNSSMHVGMNLVRDGQADGFVTMGNTGAVVGVATLQTLKRIPGVLRPPLSAIFPVASRPLLLDIGANVDCKAEQLLQFGIMGSIYMELAMGRERPRVALMSTGEEDGKGSLAVREAADLLADSGLNFVGNIESKEFFADGADVVVADGFIGNVVMKTAEAVTRMMSDMIRDTAMESWRTMLGAALMRPAFAKVRDKVNPFEVGGAPLLGVNGVVIIGHGRSNGYAVKQGVGQARRAVEQGVVEAIRVGMEAREERDEA
ncbi:MAG TPA: phosphate acyltransferase PlsX [Anaerolineae bacterium]|nr:phosphate acyltransferase PlsX [Anaerolineae bacterium]